MHTKIMHKSLAHSDRQRDLIRADAAGHADTVDRFSDGSQGVGYSLLRGYYM